MTTTNTSTTEHYFNDNECWEGLVGSQTPAEFWEISRDAGAKTFAEAVGTYLDEGAFEAAGWDSTEQAEDAREETETRMIRVLEKHCGMTTTTDSLYDYQTTDYLTAEDLGVTEEEYAAAVARSVASDDPTGAVEVAGRSVYAE